MRVKALTLLEVVAALVLVATSSVVLLNAQSRSLNQLRNLREQETASHLARELIASWKLDPAAASMAREGSFESAPGWSWRRSTTPSLVGTSLTLQEITLTIHRTESDGQRQIMSLTWLEKVDGGMR